MVLMPFFLFVKKSPAWWIPLCGGAYQQGCKYPSALAAILRVRMLMPDSPGGTRHHANDGTLRIQKPALHLRKGFFMGKYHELYIGHFYCLSVLVTRYRTVQYLNPYVMCWIHKIASRRPFYFLTLAWLLTTIWFIQQSLFGGDIDNQTVQEAEDVSFTNMQLRQCDVAALDAKYSKELADAKAECCVDISTYLWRSRRKWAYRGLWLSEG